MAQTHPLAPYKSNGSELLNTDVLSLFRQTTCSASASIHYNTLKVRKIYSYSDSRKIVKTPIVHLLLLLLLQAKVCCEYSGTPQRHLSKQTPHARVQRSATACTEYKYSEPQHTKSRAVVTTQPYASAL